MATEALDRVRRGAGGVRRDACDGAPEQAWSKQARHAIFGPSSFLEVIGFMAEHDRLAPAPGVAHPAGCKNGPRIGISPAVF